jgi:predicted nucleic acid-binding Zn ribbon protein
MIYTWRCKTCGYEVEVDRLSVKYIDVPPREFEDPDEHFDNCPADLPVWERIISKTSFILKGSGWGNKGYSK